MRKFFSFLFMLVFGLVFLTFVVANRHPVILNFDPISVDNPFYGTPVSMPLWVAMSLFLGLGFLFGATGMWMSTKGTRRKASERKREVNRLKREADALARADAQKGEEPKDDRLAITDSRK